MKLLLLTASVLVLAPISRAQVEVGDLLLNTFTSTGDLFHYEKDGTLVHSYTPGFITHTSFR